MEITIDLAEWKRIAKELDLILIDMNNTFKEEELNDKTYKDFHSMLVKLNENSNNIELFTMYKNFFITYLLENPSISNFLRNYNFFKLLDLSNKFNVSIDFLNDITRDTFFTKFKEIYNFNINEISIYDYSLNSVEVERKLFLEITKFLKEKFNSNSRILFVIDCNFKTLKATNTENLLTLYLYIKYLQTINVKNTHPLYSVFTNSKTLVINKFLNDLNNMLTTYMLLVNQTFHNNTFFNYGKIVSILVESDTYGEFKSIISTLLDEGNFDILRVLFFSVKKESP